MSGRRRGVVVLAVVAALVVAAAVALVGLRGNGSEVGATPTASPTTSPTPSPATASSGGTRSRSVVAPRLPVAAQAQTEAGAQAFLRHFIDVYNYSYSALNPLAMQALSTRDCGYCSDVISDVRASRERGLTFEAGVVSVRESIVGPDQPLTRLVMVAFIDQTPGIVRRSDGSVEEESEALDEQRIDVTVVWLDGAWKMRSVVVAGAK